MPRAIDPSIPAGGLPITHDPLNTIGFNVIPQELDLEKILESVLDTLSDQIRDLLFPAIEALTGIDLSVFLPLLSVLDLDFSTPATFLTSLFEAMIALPAALAQVITGMLTQLTSPGGSAQLTELLGSLLTLLISLPTMLIQLGQSLLESGAGLLGLDSGLNSLNLFNLVPTNLLGQLNFSNIGETFTNLITDPFFEAVDAFTGLGSWFHDATNSHAAVGGSAKTVANGTLKELLGNLIPVSVGQVLNLSGWAKWSGLTGTGNPIMLAVTGYDTNGSAIHQQTIASHNTTPPTTDWTPLSGTYTVPAAVAAIRTRLAVGNTATAGTVWWDDMSANKSQNVFQRLIAGTNPGENLTNDIEHLFTGVVSNALEIIQKVSQGDFEGLVSTITGDVQEGFEDVGARLNDFLNSLSPLNGGNIIGEIADDIVPGIGNIIDTSVTNIQNIIGGGFDTGALGNAFAAQTHALVDAAANLSEMFGRLTHLESQVAAIPPPAPSAPPSGGGTASGGMVGIYDSDDFERTSTSSLGALWMPAYSGSGSGTWATSNGHDALWIAGSGTREFIEFRQNSAVPASHTDYQRVVTVLSAAPTQVLGSNGYNDIWLRVDNFSNDLSNVTGTRIRWGADGSISIVKFNSGSPTTLLSRPAGSITAPGPGAQLIGEAGDVNGAGTLGIYRGIIGASIRIEVTDSSPLYGSNYRRWGHGGRAEGSLFGQAKPGSLHYWIGQDQTTTGAYSGGSGAGGSPG